MYLVSGIPSEEVPEHQAVTFQVSDDRFDTVSPVLLIGVSLAAPPPLAGDMNVGEEDVFTASVATFDQQILRHHTAVQKGSMSRRWSS